VGRNPSGGFSLFGPLPEDLDSKGAGSFGFCPCVTCAGKYAAITKVAAEQKPIFIRMDAIDETFLDSKSFSRHFNLAGASFTWRLGCPISLPGSIGRPMSKTVTACCFGNRLLLRATELR
jgi:hypothetical protein